MGDLVGKAQLLHRRRAVAAAHDGHGAAVSQRLGHGPGAGGEVVKLKHAHGAVPHHGARALHGAAEGLDGVGTDIQALPALGNGHGADHLALGVIGEVIRRHGVCGQQKLHAVLFGLFDHFQGVIQLIRLAQALADAAALGLGKGIRHAAADDDGVRLVQQVVDDRDLVADLGAAQHRHKGPLGVIQGLAHDGQLSGHQEAGHRRQVCRHTDGGGVGTVHGAKGVGHIQFRHVRQLLGEAGVVLLLADIEAQVLQQHDLAGLQSGGLGLGVLTHDVLDEDDLPAQQLAQTLRHGRQRQLHLPLALGLAQVGAGDDRRAVVQQILDGGQCRHDALVAGDRARFLVLGHVEVAAQQDLLALDVYILYRFFIVIHGIRSSHVKFIYLPSRRFRRDRESHSAAAPHR